MTADYDKPVVVMTGPGVYGWCPWLTNNRWLYDNPPSACFDSDGVTTQQQTSVLLMVAHHQAAGFCLVEGSLTTKQQARVLVRIVLTSSSRLLSW